MLSGTISHKPPAAASALFRTAATLIGRKPSLSADGISLAIAQRFNTWCGNEMDASPGKGRKKLSVVPMGLNETGADISRLKTRGYFQFGAEYYYSLITNHCLAGFRRDALDASMDPSADHE